MVRGKGKKKKDGDDEGSSLGTSGGAGKKRGAGRTKGESTPAAGSKASKATKATKATKAAKAAKATKAAKAKTAAAKTRATAAKAKTAKAKTAAAKAKTAAGKSTRGKGGKAKSRRKGAAKDKSKVRYYVCQHEGCNLVALDKRQMVSHSRRFELHRRDEDAMCPDTCELCLELIESGEWTWKGGRDDHVCGHIGCEYFSSSPRIANRKQAVERHEQAFPIHHMHYMECGGQCAVCQRLSSTVWHQDREAWNASQAQLVRRLASKEAQNRECIPVDQLPPLAPGLTYVAYRVELNYRSGPKARKDIGEVLLDDAESAGVGPRTTSASSSSSLSLSSSTAAAAAPGGLKRSASMGKFRVATATPNTLGAATTMTSMTSILPPHPDPKSAKARSIRRRVIRNKSSSTANLPAVLGDANNAPAVTRSISLAGAPTAAGRAGSGKSAGSGAAGAAADANAAGAEYYEYYEYYVVTQTGSVAGGTDDGPLPGLAAGSDPTAVDLGVAAAAAGPAAAAGGSENVHNGVSPSSARKKSRVDGLPSARSHLKTTPVKQSSAPSTPRVAGGASGGASGVAGVRGDVGELPMSVHTRSGRLTPTALSLQQQYSASAERHAMDTAFRPWKGAVADNDMLFPEIAGGGGTGVASHTTPSRKRRRGLDFDAVANEDGDEDDGGVHSDVDEFPGTSSGTAVAMALLDNNTARGSVRDPSSSPPPASLVQHGVDRAAKAPRSRLSQSSPRRNTRAQAGATSSQSPIDDLLGLPVPHARLEDTDMEVSGIFEPTSSSPLNDPMASTGYTLSRSASVTALYERRQVGAGASPAPTLTRVTSAIDPRLARSASVLSSPTSPLVRSTHSFDTFDPTSATSLLFGDSSGRNSPFAHVLQQ